MKEIIPNIFVHIVQIYVYAKIALHKNFTQSWHSLVEGPGPSRGLIEPRDLGPARG